MAMTSCGACLNLNYEGIRESPFEGNDFQPRAPRAESTQRGKNSVALALGNGTSARNRSCTLSHGQGIQYKRGF